MNQINNLLEQVTITQKKYDEIAKITGENFNIFSVLKMDSKEVRMHSAFIAELLNPKGSHGLKEKPLKIFINFLQSKFSNSVLSDKEINFKLDTTSTTTIVERNIGITNEDKTIGGRIDIIIEDRNKNAVIIENKIYAIEQKNQLIRYNNYSKNAPILYLTLYGDAPTTQGDLKENVHYFNISYKDDIKEWLELCLKEAVEFPMLREVIKQYIYLIKKLTQQSINNNMSADIVERMQKEVKASFEISNNISKLKEKLYNDMIHDLKNNTEGYQIVDTNHEDYYGVDVNLEGFANVIRVLFGTNKNKQLCCDVSCGYEIDVKISEQKKNEYTDNGFVVNSYWIYKWINSGNWGNSPEIWEEVAKGKNGLIYKEIILTINEIIKIENKLISTN